MRTREERNAYQRRWHAANRDRLIPKMREYYSANRKEQEDKRRYRIYGVSPERFQQMLKSQRGLCAICRRPEKRTRNGRLTGLAVDHCSKAGHVRGLLCAGCNTGLGLFQHSEVMSERVLKYLRNEVLFNQ